MRSHVFNQLKMRNFYWNNILICLSFEIEDEFPWKDIFVCFLRYFRDTFVTRHRGEVLPPRNRRSIPPRGVRALLGLSNHNDKNSLRRWVTSCQRHRRGVNGMRILVVTWEILSVGDNEGGVPAKCSLQFRKETTTTEYFQYSDLISRFGSNDTG